MSFDKQDAHAAPPDPPPAAPPSGYGYPPPNVGHGWAPYGYPPAGYPVYGYPGYGYPAGPPHEKPSTNIGWAIAAVFTFWPLAIPSFIHASKVDSFWFAGNRAGAQQASKDARLWGLIGVIVGAVLAVLAVVWIIVVLTILADAVHHVPDPTYYPTDYPT